MSQHAIPSRRIFESDADRGLHATLLNESLRDHAVTLSAFCLMDTHGHLMARPSTEVGLAAAVRDAHAAFARAMNARRGTYGPLWVPNFWSRPVPRDQIVRVVRYIEFNPVAAGIVSRAVDHRWSSARSRIGLCATPRLVTESLEGPSFEPDTWARLLGSPLPLEEVAEIERALRGEGG